MIKPFMYMGLIEYEICVCNNDVMYFKPNYMFYAKYENKDKFNTEQHKYGRRKEHKGDVIVYYFYDVNYGWCIPEQFRYKNNCEIK